MRNIFFLLLLFFSSFFFACSKGEDHSAPAINPKDSASLMTSYGVNTLVSDSGVIRYRIVAEKWEVNIVRNPSRWIFEKGLFLEQFDENFHIEAFLECDTAYYYDSKKIWELKGNVKLRTLEGTRFYSQELFWDQNSHELYSHTFSKLITPDREMQGTYFLSNEKLTHYTINNSKGSFVSSDISDSKGDTILKQPDSIKSNLRVPLQPQKGN